MNKKIALLVVYNHRYDRNIPVVENIYRKRFSNIFHLVPFYDGAKENVIAVYENSFYFENYISQAYQHLKKFDFSHFFVIADDLILNPILNETNLWDKLGLNYDECFLPGFLVLQERKEYWAHAIEALNYTLDVRGVEIENILPSCDDARLRFQKHGIPVSELNNEILGENSKLKEKIFKLLHISTSLKALQYPLVGGYSDIFLVTSDVMPKFSTYCGAFAATRLFVELAIPTSMVLCADKIRIGKDMKLRGTAIWDTKSLAEIEKTYSMDIEVLLQKFPIDRLFLHPIKLSKWYHTYNSL